MEFIRKWRENREDILQEKHRSRVHELCDMLKQIPTGKILIEFVKERKASIRFVSGLRSLASYKPYSRIHLSPKSSKNLQAMFLAHEIRHMWQDKEGLMLRNQKNTLDCLVSRRFSEADAFAIEAQVAWELTAHNILPEAWKSYKSKAKAFAKVYERALENSPVAVDNGQAMLAVFNEWFKSSYKDSYDLDSINASRKSKKRLKEGRSAGAEFDKKWPEYKARMSKPFLQEFGRISEKLNYLTGVNTHDPLYVRDFSIFNLKRIQKLEQCYPDKRHHFK